MNEDDLTIHCDIKRVSLNAGDILVVRTDVHLTAEEAKELRIFFKERFPRNEVIVLGPGFTLSVITRETKERDPGSGGESKIEGHWEVNREVVEHLKELIAASRETADEIKKRRRS